ncbi:MAG: hypothetical protein ACRDM0_21190 [Thermoleophilaceae bacterium]
MAMLFLEAIGPRGEELALAACDAAGIPVGWDEELSSATFDSDLDEAELSEQVFADLDRLDTDWRSHLRVTE